MPSNFTKNFRLNQWKPEDKVLREDFVRDNKNIEVALSSLEERVSLLNRLVPGLAYYVGQLSLRDIKTSQYYLATRCMLYEPFPIDEGLSFAGGAKMETGKVVLNGSGASGTVTALSYSIDQDWTTARLRVQFTTGDVTVKLNGEPMEYITSYGARTSEGTCWERESFWQGPKSRNAQITLEMKNTSQSSMKVYNYCVIFC